MSAASSKRGPRPTRVRARQRLSPELRRTQIMDAAAKLVVKQGFLPLSMERLAEMAGSSKALTYTYFPTQYDLFNALLKRELDNLAAAGVDAATRVDNFDQAALICALLYFQHVVQSGPLIHILLTDFYMSGHISSDATETGKAMLARLVRLASRSFDLSKKDTLSALEMVAAIPEEAGTLAFHKELGLNVARELCHSLMLSSLEALRSPERVLSGVHAARSMQDDGEAQSFD